jgi:tetratricopeptide (TPR) repeat protein
MDIEQLHAMRRRGELEQAIGALKRKVSDARASEDHAALANALIDEARAEWVLGRTDDAVMTVDEAITETRRAFGPKDPRLAEALELGGDVAADAAMPASADARFRAALELLEAAGIRGALLGDVLVHHGLFRERRGDFDGARGALLAALEATRDADDPQGRAVFATALTIVARYALEAGRSNEARTLADRALERWVALGRALRHEVGDALSVVARAALAEGDFSAALEFAQTAAQVFEHCAIDVRERRGLVEQVLGEAFAGLGRRGEARDAFDRALTFYREGAPERLRIEERILELARER